MSVSIDSLPSYQEQRAALLALAKTALEGDGLLPTQMSIAGAWGVPQQRVGRLFTHLTKSGVLAMTRVAIANGPVTKTIRVRVDAINDVPDVPLVMRPGGKLAQQRKVAILAVVRLAHRMDKLLPTAQTISEATGIPRATVLGILQRMRDDGLYMTEVHSGGGNVAQRHKVTRVAA